MTRQFARNITEIVRIAILMIALIGWVTSSRAATGEPRAVCTSTMDCQIAGAR